MKKRNLELESLIKLSNKFNKVVMWLKIYYSWKLVEFINRKKSESRVIESNWGVGEREWVRVEKRWLENIGEKKNFFFRFFGFWQKLLSHLLKDCTLHTKLFINIKNIFPRNQCYGYEKFYIVCFIKK